MLSQARGFAREGLAAQWEAQDLPRASEALQSFGPNA
jgi:hypothetical protein